MNTSGDLVVYPQVETTIALKDVTALARFSDPRGGALSFYLCSSDVTESAERSEAVAIKNLIRGVSEEVLKSVDGIDKDLEAILATGHHIRSEPNRLRAIFACLGQHVWREFSLPVTAPQISLRRRMSDRFAAELVSRYSRECTFLFSRFCCQIGLKSFRIWRRRRGSNPRPLP
jgi:hypothetical protein